MYDALDTLWIMDMKPQFERAVHWISLAEFHSKKVRPSAFPPLLAFKVPDLRMFP